MRKIIHISSATFRSDITEFADLRLTHLKFRIDSIIFTNCVFLREQEVFQLEQLYVSHMCTFSVHVSEPLYE